PSSATAVRRAASPTSSARATRCRSNWSTNATRRARRRSASPDAAPGARPNASTRPRSMRSPRKSSWSAGLNMPETSSGPDALLQSDGGQLRHLLPPDGLPRERIVALLDRAEALRTATCRGARPLGLLAGRTVMNLFFEPSTRTRTSFDLAAQRLGAQVVNFDIASSSTIKGETLLDTVHTLEAMHCDAFVVRHKESGPPGFIARHLLSGAAVVNAGDGNHAHPTQGLLDMLTLRRHRPDFAALRVVICGDIRHSRVARSDIHALRTLGVDDLRLCAPAQLLPAE